MLDAGCGDGWLSVILGKRGAVVDAFDISVEGIRTAERRAELNGVGSRCRFTVGSFYSIPFPDESFDAVIDQSILHHLGHKDQAAAELYRVMKPGARAVFAEPFGNSLWLERLRLLIPVESQAPEDPTEWARQFKDTDLEAFRAWFEVQVEEYHLFSRFERILSSKRLIDGLGRLDRRLLPSMRWLRPYARSVVVELLRREPTSPSAL